MNLHRTRKWVKNDASYFEHGLTLKRISVKKYLSISYQTFTGTSYNLVLCSEPQKNVDSI